MTHKDNIIATVVLVAFLALCAWFFYAATSTEFVCKGKTHMECHWQ